jgi:hypothetical protein
VSAVDTWIKAWAEVPQGELYPPDKDYLEEVKNELSRSRRGDKELWVPSLEGRTRTGKFHCRLGGVPYVGDLKKARIFLLMVNPTVCDDDYEDIKSDAALKMFKENRLQSLDYCFALRDEGPKGWVKYYCSSRAFGKLIETLDAARLEILKRNLAILELVPYFSQNADLITALKIVEGLPADKGKGRPAVFAPPGRPALRSASA